MQEEEYISLRKMQGTENRFNRNVEGEEARHESMEKISNSTQIPIGIDSSFILL